MSRRGAALLATSVLLAAVQLQPAAADLFVLGLFPIDPDGKGLGFGGHGRAERAEHFRFAQALINDKADGLYDELLPDDTVHIKIADCEDVRGCQAALLYALDSISSTDPDAWPRIDAVVGPYSSSATLSTLPISSYYNLPQVSYSATSPSLSGSDPYFFRVPPPDSAKANAMVQLLELFGTTADWAERSRPEAERLSPQWRAAIIQTDGAFGRGFTARFKEKFEMANGGETAITGIETIDMSQITGVDFIDMGPELKLVLQNKLRELTDTFGARVIVIGAHAEDTFKILQVADELGIADVLWLVLDPNTLPRVSELTTIRNGVFGLADRTPDYPNSIQYSHRWQSWGSNDTGACPCCASSAGCGSASGNSVGLVVTGARRYYINGNYEPTNYTCGGQTVWQRVEGYLPTVSVFNAGQPVLLKGEGVDGAGAGAWLFTGADMASSCESRGWAFERYMQCDGPLSADCAHGWGEQLFGSWTANDRLLIEESPLCSCDGSSCPSKDVCWQANLPQREALWQGARGVFTSPATATPSVLAPVVDKDAQFNTVGGYGWFVHDSLLAVATAFHNALTSPTEDGVMVESVAVNGRWLPDVHCSQDQSIGEEATLLAAQTACYANDACSFVEDLSPLAEGPFGLCSGSRDMLVHCSAASGVGDTTNAASQCSRVFDQSSDPHLFEFAPHREEILEACLLISPANVTAAELSVLSDACAATLVAGDSGSCGTGCCYQVPSPRQIVTGQQLRYQLKTLNISGVTGPLSFDFAHDREQYAFKLWNLQDGVFVHEWTIEQGFMDVECYDPTDSEIEWPAGECGGLAFPDGTSRVSRDSVGTQAERSAETARQAEVARLLRVAQDKAVEAERQNEKEKKQLWDLIGKLLIVIAVLGVLIAGGSLINRYRRKTLVERAHAAVELAADYKRAALRERMGDISLPENWEIEDGDELRPMAPYKLKVELSPSDDEYWDVHDRLRAPTDCGYGSMGGKIGDPKDESAWISSVHRLQNPYLCEPFLYHSSLVPLGSGSCVLGCPDLLWRDRHVLYVPQRQAGPASRSDGGADLEPSGQHEW